MVSLEDILGPEQPSLSLEDVLSAPDSNNQYPFGHLSSNYRNVLYGPLGKPFRWFVKLDAEDGECYEEQAQALNGAEMASIKCLVWDTQVRLEGAPYGQQSENRTMLSVLPEEVEMNTGDLALLTEPKSAKTAFNRFQRVAGSIHVLPHWPCSEIVGVWVEGVKLAPSTYTAVPEGIYWGPNAPAVGVRFSVRWKYLPLYQWSGDEQGALQLGADGQPLPQIGQVHLLRDFDKTLILP